MTEQHHKPCASCPFTRKFEPDLEPGGSPLRVYVAQHFMPFQVPCHECVKYDDTEHGWKEGTVKEAQCVGFAECRNGGGTDEFMPDGLLKETHDPDGDAFKDIWDFWAWHKQTSRQEALIEVRPGMIMAFCIEELQRNGKMDIMGEASADSMIQKTMRIVGRAWEVAVREEFRYPSMPLAESRQV